MSREDELLPENFDVPADLVLSREGNLIFSLMELSRIDEEDLRELAELLNK